MRIRLLLAVLLVGACSSAGVRAQANFALSNAKPGGVDINAPVYDWAGNLLAGPDWRAELYGGGTQYSLNPVLDFTYRTREIVPFYTPGYFRSLNGFLSVLDVPPYGWAWLQVKVWDVQLGATYEAAAARGLGGYGESDLFYARGGAPRDTLALPPPLIGLQSFSVLQEVPEPSVWTLMLLGGCALMWSGRRPANRSRRPAPGSVFGACGSSTGDGGAYRGCL